MYGHCPWHCFTHTALSFFGTLSCPDTRMYAFGASLTSFLTCSRNSELESELLRYVYFLDNDQSLARCGSALLEMQVTKYQFDLQTRTPMAQIGTAQQVVPVALVPGSPRNTQITFYVKMSTLELHCRYARTVPDGAGESFLRRSTGFGEG